MTDQNLGLKPYVSTNFFSAVIWQSQTRNVTKKCRGGQAGLNIWRREMTFRIGLLCFGQPRIKP